MRPLVSVVIPVFNSSKTIGKTIESVVLQTYTNIELILVDDGSTDNSRVLINEIIAKFNSYDIKLVCKENGGVSSARNLGIKKSKGEFIAFLDSDDLWDSTKIEIQMDEFDKNSEMACIGTNMNGLVLTSMFGIKFGRIIKISPKMMLLKNFLCIQTILVKKSVFETIGYFWENQINEDSNLMIRMTDKFHCFLLNESHVTYTYNESGLSKNFLRMEIGELLNIHMSFKMNIIRFYEYPFLVVFSLLKFMKRILNFYLFKKWKF